MGYNSDFLYYFNDFSLLSSVVFLMFYQLNVAFLMVSSSSLTFPYMFLFMLFIHLVSSDLHEYICISVNPHISHSWYQSMVYNIISGDEKTHIHQLG